VRTGEFITGDYLWATLGAVAQATTTLRLRPCVAQIPLRDPATFVRQALSLDHISGARIELGLGIGLTVDPSYAMMGIANWSNRERVARRKPDDPDDPHEASDDANRTDYSDKTDRIVGAVSLALWFTVAAAGRWIGFS